MTEKYSLSRQKAEIAFNAIQTQFFSKGEAAQELASINESRDAKTKRLREARLAKKLEDSAVATSALIAKRAGPR
ncbi:hypothetical protein [Shinella oryzae]|jgi:hypothetical protein|uniref:Uncharacterized protein n=1 Tax=Shinella oryzae TaxID=2871820 RepID=A0ABY9KD77_9HYPH|nr:hypothetical protein [Shinella oryzae]WLS06138.1 hypothetical protein Q9315_20005 [Shinella oryzae]